RRAARRRLLLERGVQHALDRRAVGGAAAAVRAVARPPAQPAAAGADLLPGHPAAAERHQRRRRRGDLQPAVRPRVRADQHGARGLRVRPHRLAGGHRDQPRRDRHDDHVAVDRLQRADLPRRDAGRAAGAVRGRHARRRLHVPAAPQHHDPDDPADDHLHGHRVDDRLDAGDRRADAVRRPGERGRHGHRRLRPAVPDPRPVPVRAGLPQLRVRLRLGRGLGDVPAGRARRRDELPDRPADAGVARLMTNALIPGPATAGVTRIRRPRRGAWREFASRPLTYLTLIAVAFFSAFPIYWSVVVASHDNSALAQIPPPLLPGGNFFANVARVFDTAPFQLALINSVIVAGSITISVMLFSTLAGFAFAKLRFRGRNALLVLTIATMMVPTQLGIIPLYMMMIKLE